MVRAVAGGETLGSAVRANSSTTDAVAAREAGGSASSTFGTMPMPMITTSHGNSRPSAVSTAVTRVVPCSALTAAPQ